MRHLGTPHQWQAAHAVGRSQRASVAQRIGAAFWPQGNRLRRGRAYAARSAGARMGGRLNVLLAADAAPAGSVDAQNFATVLGEVWPKSKPSCSRTTSPGPWSMPGWPRWQRMPLFARLADACVRSASPAGSPDCQPTTPGQTAPAGWPGRSVTINTTDYGRIPRAWLETPRYARRPVCQDPRQGASRTSIASNHFRSLNSRFANLEGDSRRWPATLSTVESPDCRLAGRARDARSHGRGTGNLGGGPLTQPAVARVLACVFI